MNKFYPHKWTREEALKEAIEYNSLDDLKEIIFERYYPGNIEISPIEITYSKEYTHIVLLNDCAVGYAFVEKKKHLCDCHEANHEHTLCAAIDICIENDDGEFWISNGEFNSRVNYCPFCGKKAPKTIEKDKR